MLPHFNLKKIMSFENKTKVCFDMLLLDMLHLLYDSTWPEYPQQADPYWFTLTEVELTTVIRFFEMQANYFSRAWVQIPHKQKINSNRKG